MEPDDLRKLMEDQLRLSRSLKARVRELEEAQEAHRAPLAVVGTALRLPGGLTTPEAYWEFLLGGADALGPIPEDRPGLRRVFDPRPDRPGSSYVDRAGFLADVAGFDPAFFGISQREAEALDPQQRLLLECAWEAMERAGIAVRRQDRLNAGVFVGIMSAEYVERMAAPDDKTGIDPYYGTGGGHCMAAGRISYVMGLSGPALSCDTACSSSLVALHLAAQSLRRGECRYALVGGANLVLSPDLMVSLCQNRALAPDGRSKTFTAAADGYGRGEGVGMLVLMRLDQAEREGRPVLAVLRGTAVNHDGASSGLTVPSGPAQQEVIRAALADARVAPGEVGFVEAHGTGTALGDPIEVGALDAVLGSGAAGRAAPLAVGSVKSRIGHLEAAAGIAGLIKLVLMLRHGRIPAALGAADGELNPLIPWERVAVTVPRASEEWPAAFERRIGGISAFGMSGTNAHALLEAYEPEPVATVEPGRTELLVLSARSAESLRELAGSVALLLKDADAASVASLCHTLNTGRTPFEHRLAVTGRTGAELASALTEGRPSVTRGAKPTVGLRVTADHPELAGRLRELGLRITELPGAPTAGYAQLEWEGQVLPLVTDRADRTPELLATALAALFLAGADLRLAALRAPGARLLGDLPTYPFQRRRCWIDERPVDAAVPLSAGSEPEVGGSDDPDRDLVEEFLAAELATVLRATEALDPQRTYLEVGGDSFTAMQFAMAVEREYQVELPVEEFTEEVPLATLFRRLGEHILRAGQEQPR
ncbi:beta-ketoacyl synthase N-terminal-like domain-containing protein [Kitasatospora viridis]|uniref:Phosphopantetheine binding protein n=1 Tax=Kitasatospora viridis TaxID=281105 RepID=A0A561UJT7_9ACTN|nr:type I polyketide synthase [Kitasatospora viridis]TWF99633.1 phosphopantetheine binding protein [Kitasatospora viridis]